MRGEARLERLASSYTGDAVPSSSSSSSGHKLVSTNFTIDVDLAEEKPTTREEGRTAWNAFLRERFVRGGDEDFDYSRVDGDEELDAMENQDREEAYFDEEEPEWADDSDDGEQIDDEATSDGTQGGGDGKARPKRERVLMGQTGIQDY